MLDRPIVCERIHRAKTRPSPKRFSLGGSRLVAR
jgi:hypothetical protein